MEDRHRAMSSAKSAAFTMMLKPISGHGEIVDIVADLRPLSDLVLPK